MPASVTSNFHHASRAEILADYVFSSWGTVTPSRRTDDIGIDLYCTLTERIGQRSVVRAYYSVQVKSNSDPWIFKDEEEIRWLFDYPTPLFLACVDQKALVLSVYQTMPRYLAGMWPPGKQLVLVPSSADEGKCAQWDDGERFDLAAPIIRVSVEDIVRGDRMENFHRILSFWVDADRDAGELRRMGLLRFWMPHRYTVNQNPEMSNVQQGMTRPSEEHRRQGVRTAVEALDYIGDQLLRANDREGAVYAALLIRHLVDRDPAFFQDHKLVGHGGSMQLENSIGPALNQALFPGQQGLWLFRGLELIKSGIRASEAFAKVIGSGKPTQAETEQADVPPSEPRTRTP